MNDFLNECIYTLNEFTFISLLFCIIAFSRLYSRFIQQTNKRYSQKFRNKKKIVTLMIILKFIQ